MEGRPPEESEPVERARWSDVGACERLMERYHEVAFGTAYLVSDSASEAEDAAEASVDACYGPRSSIPWQLRLVSTVPVRSIRRLGCTGMYEVVHESTHVRVEQMGPCQVI